MTSGPEIVRPTVINEKCIYIRIGFCREINVKLTLELKILRDDRREEGRRKCWRGTGRSCGFGREGSRKVCGLLMNSEHESVNSDA